MAALADRRAAVGGRNLGHRRPDADAGAGHPVVSRNLGRELAEEIRARGHVSRPLRQRDRQPRHQAQRFRPARGYARPSDQGDARDRGPALLRTFRHRLFRHLPRAGDQRARRRRACKAAPPSPSSSPRTCSCRTSAPSSARSTKRSSRCGWKPTSPRTRSSSFISTAPIWAAAPSGSTARRNIISANRCATSPCRKPRCWPACSRRRANSRRS